MSKRTSLRTRLITSYLLVVATVLIAAFFAVRLLAPRFAQRRFQGGLGPGGSGFGPGGPEGGGATTSDLLTAYNDGLTLALLIAGLLGLLVALGMAFWLAKRVLGRVREVQRVTERMASGDFSEMVPEPVEAELAELTNSINSLGAELAATEEARAQLMSDLAHELRNPLATIEGYMEGLIDGVVPAEPKTFSIVAEEAHRMRRLTEDLSLMSRVQERALDLDLDEADLADLTRAVVDRLGPQFQSKGVDLELDVIQPLPVECDTGRLNQAMTNVIGNALAHTPEGGKVTVRGRKAAGMCQIEIKDTGAGIPPEQLDHIFDRFTRLDGEKSGTGIGLHISRALVRAHGGDLTAHSEGPGSGSTFTLAIPVRYRVRIPPTR